MNLPAYVPPNSPQVSNYVAAQSVNPSQPFTLNWNTFTNGGSTDWILLEIEGGPVGALFETPIPGQPNALNGTATSVMIPAGTLPADSTNTAVLAFYHVAASTNGASRHPGLRRECDLLLPSSRPRMWRRLGAAINIRPSGANVILTWPTNAAGYALEFRPPT